MNILEQIIREHISLPPRTNTQGWYPILCKVCGDHGRKGKRAGFRFDNGTVGYNCFNCGHTAAYDPTKNPTLPTAMVTVLDAFDVSDTDRQKIILSGLKHQIKYGLAIRDNPTTEILQPQPINVPPYFIPLKDEDNDISQLAITHLKEQRNIDFTQYQFYIGVQTDKTSEPWVGRLIIPIFKDQKLVFFQGRDLSGVHKKKYLSPGIPKDNIIYGYDHLFENVDDPLYITEGWFDAWHLKGVCVFGNKMTQNQIRWINQTKRQKVIVPDRYGNGKMLAEQGVQLGWSVSTPINEIGDCKDITEAVVKYGKPFILRAIRKSTHSDYTASVNIKFYCKQ